MAEFLSMGSCSTSMSAMPTPLYCAPCPPPFVTYTEFVYIALEQNLTGCEMLTVANKCRMAVQQSTTHTSGAGNTTVKPTRGPKHVYVCILLSVLFVLVVTAVVAILAYFKLYRKSGMKNTCRKTPSTQEFMTEKSDVCSEISSGIHFVGDTTVYNTCENGTIDTTETVANRELQDEYQDMNGTSAAVKVDDPDTDGDKLKTISTDDEHLMNGQLNGRGQDKHVSYSKTTNIDRHNEDNFILYSQRNGKCDPDTNKSQGYTN